MRLLSQGEDNGEPLNAQIQAVAKKKRKNDKQEQTTPTDMGQQPMPDNSYY
jgi:hypothetical protein